jgi:hypothetical protein
MFYNSEAIPKLWTNQKLSHGIAITWRVLVISGLSNEGLDWKKSADVMTSLSKGLCFWEMTIQRIIFYKCWSYNIPHVISFPKWGLAIFVPYKLRKLLTETKNFQFYDDYFQWRYPYWKSAPLHIEYNKWLELTRACTIKLFTAVMYGFPL